MRARVATSSHTKEVGAALRTITRTAGQMRSSLVPIAQAAQINACYECYGPDGGWGFADATGWKCSPRYCPYYRSCPAERGRKAASRPPNSRHRGKTSGSSSLVTAPPECWRAGAADRGWPAGVPC